MNNETHIEADLQIQSLGETMEDIPQAVRNRGISSVEPRKNNPIKSNFVLFSSILIFFISIVMGLFVYRPSVSSQDNSNPDSIVDNSTNNNSTNNQEESNHLLGHLSYEEAPLSELKGITADNRLKLREGAADKFLAMQKAARRDGVILAPLSAYRTIEEQNKLFFEVKAQRGQVATKRAEVSAPPGYSEHHTGYAIDIGDANVPATNLNQDFENTRAYQWLEKNASTYSFELSFPKDNPQGVSYEPWHWRFVGDRNSLETFYKAKNQQKSNPNSENN